MTAAFPPPASADLLLPGTCAAVARDLDEPQAGTAPHARGVLAIEDDGPWGPKVPSGSRWLPTQVARELDAAAADAGVRLQLIRRVGHAHARTRRRRHTVLLAHTGPDTPWLESMTVGKADELLDLPLNALVEPSPPGAGDPDQRIHLLACTHARRDQCCARAGRPIASLLVAAPGDHEVWETSHTGGHRFAPNVLVLPSGALYGRLALDDVDQVIAAARDGHLLPDYLRGRMALTPAEQVAEVAFLHGAGRAAGAPRLQRVSQDGDETVLEVTDGATRLRIVVAHRLTGAPRPVSCGAEPTDPGVWEPRSVQHLP